MLKPTLVWDAVGEGGGRNSAIHHSLWQGATEEVEVAP
jgi:hypothetical protein